jgi:hypothetical protein
MAASVAASVAGPAGRNSSRLPVSVFVINHVKRFMPHAFDLSAKSITGWHARSVLGSQKHDWASQRGTPGIGLKVKIENFSGFLILCKSFKYRYLG